LIPPAIPQNSAATTQPTPSHSPAEAIPIVSAAAGQGKGAATPAGRAVSDITVPCNAIAHLPGVPDGNAPVQLAKAGLTGA
jgi:hypothetical protein